tara:strand:- start:417 stop:1283 length:867 start_codon:yes stop_codon:yes gene_type:complete
MEISRHLTKKSLVVANDSGAANQIYYFLKNEKKLNLSFFLTGPAKDIFKKENCSQNLISAIKSSDLVLTGTGWQSKTEYNAIKYSKKYKIKVISFVDSPHNLNFRFNKRDKYFFPDIIVTKDESSFLKIKDLISKNIKLIKTKDYFVEFVKRNKILPKSNKILYLSSNYDDVVRKSRKKKIDYDIKLLNIFYKKIKKNRFLKNKKIFLRVHPSENKNKYIHSKIFKDMNIKITKENDFLKCIRNFKFVFGCETYGLVIAKYYGLKSYNNLKGTNIKPYLSKKFKLKIF